MSSPIFLFLLSLGLFNCLSRCIFSCLFFPSLPLSLAVSERLCLPLCLSPLGLPMSLFVSPSHVLSHLSFSVAAGANRLSTGRLSGAADAGVTLRLFILKALGVGLVLLPFSLSLHLDDDTFRTAWS